jgi:hypothetical protein
MTTVKSSAFFATTGSLSRKDCRSKVVPYSIEIGYSPVARAQMRISLAVTAPIIGPCISRG